MGGFANLTQIGMEVNTMDVASKLGNHGVNNKITLPQNHGTSFSTKSSFFLVSIWTMKNTLEQR